MDTGRKFLGLLFLVLVLALPGCGEKEEEGAVKLFYVNYDKGIIEAKDFQPKAEDMQGLVDEMAAGIADPEDGVLLLPEDVSVLNYEISGDILRLNFSSGYRKMSAVDEVLCRAAIVKNFVQLEGISYVRFFVDGEDLVDSKGNPVGMLGSNSFLENSGKDITAYQYTELTLYFANKSGDGLVKEKRNVYYTSNSSIEKVVVEQLIRGPKEEGHYATLPASTGILSVSQADGIAYVNLDQRFVSEALTIQQELPIYSIVNSLIETGNVTRVQISVNGDNRITFQESMKLDQLYEVNLDLVEEEKESENEG